MQVRRRARAGRSGGRYGEAVVQRAGELCFGRHGAGGALGVAAREELFLPCGSRMRPELMLSANRLNGPHEFGGSEHRVMRGRGHRKCAGEGLVVIGLAHGGPLGEDG